MISQTTAMIIAIVIGVIAIQILEYKSRENE
jgi:hypothetical protein